jgi:hypothetical protein
LIKKARLLEHIEKFPESFSIEELIERLILIDQLEQRIQESEKGEVIGIEQLKAEINQWSKSVG